MGHILDAGIVTGALGAWCRMGMTTRVRVGSHLEINLMWEGAQFSHGGKFDAAFSHKCWENDFDRAFVQGPF